MNVCKSRLKGYRLFAVDEFIWLFVEQTMCGGSVLGGGGGCPLTTINHAHTTLVLIKSHIPGPLSIVAISYHPVYICRHWSIPAGP